MLPERSGGEFGATILTTRHAAFQAGTDFRTQNFEWLESTLRFSATWRLLDSLTLEVGGVGAATLDMDYYRRIDDILGMVDPLRLDLRHGGFGLTVGRHDVVLGDGFLVGDGYNDDLAARYSVPLRFWDGVSAREALGRWRFHTLAAKLSDSYGFKELGTTYTADGEVYALDVSRGALGATGFLRNDGGTADEDLRIVSARALVPAGRFELSAEYAFQGGSVVDQKTRAFGYHADLGWHGAKDAYVRLRHARFSGDDPATATQEEFLSWHYPSTDWEQWYLGDIVGARFLLNANQRSYSIDGSFSPVEDWSARLVIERFELDRAPLSGDRYFATEADFVLDWKPSRAWEFWFLFAAAAPGPAAPGDYVTTEAFLNLTHRFGSR